MFYCSEFWRFVGCTAFSISSAAIVLFVVSAFGFPFWERPLSRFANGNNSISYRMFKKSPKKLRLFVDSFSCGSRVLIVHASILKSQVRYLSYFRFVDFLNPMYYFMDRMWS